MLAADKLLLECRIARNTTELKRKEFSLHHLNLTTVGTQAAVLAGFGATALIESGAGAATEPMRVSPATEPRVFARGVARAWSRTVEALRTAQVRPAQGRGSRTAVPVLDVQHDLARVQRPVPRRDDDAVGLRVVALDPRRGRRADVSNLRDAVLRAQRGAGVVLTTVPRRADAVDAGPTRSSRAAGSIRAGLTRATWTFRVRSRPRRGGATWIFREDRSR